MNLILFDEGTNKPKTPIVITGPDLTKKFHMWVNTMKETDTTQAGFKKINDDINNAVGSIDTKIVSITNQNKAADAKPVPPDAGSVDASKADQLDDPKNPKPNVDPKPVVSKEDLVKEASAKISVAISRLWAPLAPMIIRAMMNQYGYIKAAYGLVQATHQAHTPEGGAPEEGQL